MDATNSITGRRGLTCIVGPLALCLVAATTSASEPDKGRQCLSVGGTVMTNFIAETTTLGTATGDLRGAVSATLLGQAADGDSFVFTIQHHWVTDGGDTILMGVAQATAKPVAEGLFAIVWYPVTISGRHGTVCRRQRAPGEHRRTGRYDRPDGVPLSWRRLLCGIVEIDSGSRCSRSPP